MKIEGKRVGFRLLLTFVGIWKTVKNSNRNIRLLKLICI